MPFRPRAYGNVNTTPGGKPKGGWLETEEEYEAIKDEALGGGGYGAMAQMQTSAGQAAMMMGEGTGASTGGGYGKKRVGEQSRGQMNLTSGQSRSILTGG